MTCLAKTLSTTPENAAVHSIPGGTKAADQSYMKPRKERLQSSGSSIGSSITLSLIIEKSMSNYLLDAHGDEAFDDVYFDTYQKMIGAPIIKT
jgi:hypothetical protein